MHETLKCLQTCQPSAPLCVCVPVRVRCYWTAQSTTPGTQTPVTRHVSMLTKR